MVSDPNPYSSPQATAEELAGARMKHKRLLGTAAAMILWIAAAVLIVRAELNARSIQARLDSLKARLPDRIVEIKTELESTDLSAERREELEGELRWSEEGFTGILPYAPANVRQEGYAWGIAMFLTGLPILAYCYRSNKKRGDAKR